MSEASEQTQNQMSQPATGKLTPELVKAVSDKVYAMLLEELRIERERLRTVSSASRRPQ
jgi:hypothetical protein